MNLRLLGLPALLALATGCFDEPEPAGEDSSAATGDSGTSTTTTATTSSATTQSTSTDSATTASATTDPTTTDATDPTTTGVDETTTGPETDSRGSSGGEGVCGDGVQDRGEVCDDGVNAGQIEGDCAPDCSAVVQQKLIRLSQSSTQSNFAPGMNPVFVADSYCPGGYLAFFADGVNRVASVGPLLGNGQVDWVLQPWTEYVNPDGDRMWTTTELLLLGVADDNTWVGLVNPLVASTNFGFTGMYGDYTTSSNTCAGWSSTAGTDGSVGQVHMTTERFVGPPVGGPFAICSVAHEFICVEQ